MKICHITPLHPRSDIRIFLKECSSLAKAGFDVSLVVADGKADEFRNGVSIFGVEKNQTLLKRILKTPKLIFNKAVQIDAMVYHLHDPELLPIGLKLKKKGKKVIFDFHEDVEMQLLSKPYWHPLVGRLVSIFYSLFEKYAIRKIDLIITATPHIRNKFTKMHSNVIDINNFPIIGELQSDTLKRKSGYTVIYIGSITEIRGIKQLVKALELCKADVRLKLAGEFDSQSLRNEVMEYDGWKKVDELGFLDRNKIKKLLSEVQVGIVLFLPLPNHIDAQPNKMFEYMSAGIPIISSNFPLWKNIVEGNNCGICIDPTDVKAIAQTIDWMIEHTEEARIMGENGLESIKKYNWNIEEEKLLKAYRDIGIIPKKKVER